MLQGYTFTWPVVWHLLQARMLTTGTCRTSCCLQHALLDTVAFCAAVVRVRPANAGEGRYFVRVPEGELLQVYLDNMTQCSIRHSVVAINCC